MEKHRLPENLRSYFWDFDFQNLSIEKDGFTIISRLLELGDESAVRFLFASYRPDEMIPVLNRSRSISERSRRFWRLFFQTEEGSCTPIRYPTPYGICSRD